MGSFAAAAIAQKDRKSIYASLTTTTTSTTNTRLLPLFTTMACVSVMTGTRHRHRRVFFFIILVPFLSFVTQWSPGIGTDRLADLCVSVPEGGKKQGGGGVVFLIAIPFCFL